MDNYDQLGLKLMEDLSLWFLIIWLFGLWNYDHMGVINVSIESYSESIWKW
jgi:hypothetical protein